MRFYGIKKGLCWTAKVRLWQWITYSQLELLTNSHLTFLKLTTLEDKGTHTELKYFYFLRLYGLILRPVLRFAFVWINTCWVRINLPLLSKIKPPDFRLPKKHFGDVMIEVLLNVSNYLLDCNISQYIVAKSIKIT